jgi:glycosyltransferase involved in cell wall biosynthesis
MKLACVTIAYMEERFMPKFIQSMQDRVDEIVVLNSIKPWNNRQYAEVDKTASIAHSLGATVISDDWATEQDQRNAGQEYCTDYDWIIVLDPDEYILEPDWQKLVKFLEQAPLPAYVTNMQHTYWKSGYVIDPPEDYKQIIAVRPQVRFVDKRVIDSPWAHAPIELHHFSWARSDVEVWRKITSYGHAGEFDAAQWMGEIWLDWNEDMQNLHPLTPPSLLKALRVELPEELERLNLWP